MSQQTWRNIFIGIIVLTIPCYALAIMTYYVRGGGTPATSTPAVRPSITPFDPNLLVTQTVRALQTLGTEDFGTQPTALDIDDETPVSIVTNTPVFAFNTSTPVQVFPPTATATVFTVPTNTPTVFVPPTNTSTPVPSPTQPILVPPTDTPSP
ncbi:MAG: hypothetical protein AAFN11_05435 [Chloroflexota bacterium]